MMLVTVRFEGPLRREDIPEGPVVAYFVHGETERQRCWRSARLKWLAGSLRGFDSAPRGWLWTRYGGIKI